MKKVLYLLFALFTFSLAHSAVLDTDRKEEKKIEISDLVVKASYDAVMFYQVEKKRIWYFEVRTSGCTFTQSPEQKHFL